VDSLQVSGWARSMTVQSTDTFFKEIYFRCDDCGAELSIPEPSFAELLQIICDGERVCRFKANVNMGHDSLSMTTDEPITGLQLQCNGYESCKYSNFQIAGYSIDADIQCHGFQVCSETSFVFMDPGDVTLDCGGGGYGDCAGLKLDANRADHLEVSCTTDSSCRAMEVHCPGMDSHSCAINCGDGGCDKMKVISIDTLVNPYLDLSCIDAPEETCKGDVVSVECLFLDPITMEYDENTARFECSDDGEDYCCPYV